MPEIIIPSQGYHLIETLRLPKKDFDQPIKLVISPNGKQIIVSSLNGKICLIQNTEKPTFTSLVSKKFYTSQIRNGIDISSFASEDEANKTISDYIDGVPGLYTSASFYEKIDWITYLEGSFDKNTGLASRVVAISNNGFLLDWQKQNNNKFELLSPKGISEDIAFAKSVKILPHGHLAFCDLANGLFQIVESTKDQQLKRKMSIEIPDETGGNKIVQTFSILELSDSKLLLAIADSSEALHLFNINYKDNVYEIEDQSIVENPTKHIELSQNQQSESDPITDPQVVWGKTNNIAIRNKNMIAVAHSAGILFLYRDNENDKWHYEVIKFPNESLRYELGGSGSPTNIVFLDDNSIAANYTHGRVAVWSKENDIWKPEIVKDNRSDWELNDIDYKNGKLFVSGSNKSGHGVIEVYTK